MGYESFKELRVWRHARDLAVETCRVTAGDAFSSDYSFRNQARKAAVLIKP